MRTCGTCTKCCDGWLHATIFDYKMGGGNACPLRIKEVGCAIHNDPTRPSLCKVWKCGWLGDDGTLFDEWMKPETVGFFLIKSRVDEIVWYTLSECGQEVSKVMLSYLIQNAIDKNINFEYWIGRAQFLIGTNEFKELAMKIAREEKAG